MNTKNLGDYAEIITAAKFTKQGYIVSKPLSENSTYDLIVDMDGQLKKVQVKARSTRNNTISVELFTSMRNYKKEYKEGDFDLLVIYSEELDKLAIISWDELKDLKVLTLRTVKPKNKQKIGVKMFNDYLFE